MYSRWQIAAKYFKYYLTSSSGKGHGIHSPFVFEFITKVLHDKDHYPEYDKVEGTRTNLLKNNKVLKVEDFGAGSAVSKTSKRSIFSILKYSFKSKKIGQLLFRIVKHYQPETILELGTSLGITTSYLGLGRPAAKLVTMEGAVEVAAVANGIIQSFGLLNTSIVHGNFDKTLPEALDKLATVDFAFIDGNHSQEPTERYFQQLLSKINNDSILVFDDIHWSREMEQAWENIKKHPSVRCTIDLFFTGIVFFRQEFREKQQYTIRF